jgi:hypothetical protein
MKKEFLEKRKCECGRVVVTKAWLKETSKCGTCFTFGLEESKKQLQLLEGQLQ